MEQRNQYRPVHGQNYAVHPRKRRRSPSRYYDDRDYDEDTYENYYNDTDSVPKVDNLDAVSGSYYAMENWGLITYFSTLFSYDDPLLLGHEVAHYWHGNKVTCSNWHE